MYDGEVLDVVEIHTTPAGNRLVLRSPVRQELRNISLKELLSSDRAQVLTDESGPAADDDVEIAAVALGKSHVPERRNASENAAHVREILTGYKSGTDANAADGEPRPGFDPGLPLTQRYEAKAIELGMSSRTLMRWVSDYQKHGEAGLLSRSYERPRRVDPAWVETAFEVMAEHTDQSRPSKSMVISRANARVRLRNNEAELPSRTSAYRVLEELERQQPTFRLSTKRNRDIADRPPGPYGKLRPTRPGEYQVLDTNRLDVFALDPLTLRWVQAELTVGMDWYSRCITGIRVTPVSTKSIDAASILYQSFRPRPAGKNWPENGVWPEHGLPKTVLIDPDAADGTTNGTGGPAVAPETIVIDHGQIYVSEHLTSVCKRMGISIQPAQPMVPRQKGPVERFFRTIREDLLQALPGYKGPDVHSRGADPEGDAFFFINELEDIIREWTAVVYHNRPHDSLVDPGIPGLRMSPAQMYEHGVARAGYIDVPRDPDLGYEFLEVEWRTIQHYGIQIGRRRYNGPALDPYRDRQSPYKGKANGKWPFHQDPDDITRVYFRDPETRKWNTLMWEHAPSMTMPMSEDALNFARKLAKSKYRYPDDRLAVADLLERWNLDLSATKTERRMALRLSREQRAIELPDPPENEIEHLPSVKRIIDSQHASERSDTETGQPEQPETAESSSETNNDDQSEEPPITDFYADALDDA